MVNNFNLIEPLLEFPKDNNFYFLQILQRKKDHPGVMLGGSNNNSRLVKAYYITSKERLRVYEEEIIKLCEVFNARASINLNPRSFEKAAFSVLRKIADQMSNRDFYSVRKAYDSICGEYHSEMDKRWLIDIDKEQMSQVDNIRAVIFGLQAMVTNKEYKMLADIPSKSGLHIITNPFNLDAFSRLMPGIEVHKNNPTNLFIP